MAVRAGRPKARPVCTGSFRKRCNAPAAVRSLGPSRRAAVDKSRSPGRDRGGTDSPLKIGTPARAVRPLLRHQGPVLRHAAAPCAPGLTPHMTPSPPTPTRAATYTPRTPTCLPFPFLYYL